METTDSLHVPRSQVTVCFEVQGQTEDQLTGTENKAEKIKEQKQRQETKQFGRDEPWEGRDNQGGVNMRESVEETAVKLN